MNISDYTKNDYETFLLQRFLDFCESTDLDKIYRRHIATEFQFNRNMFEMDDSKGRIRISKTENPNYKQYGEPQYLYFATGWFFDRASVSFVIKEEVYHFLISKYFGSFKPTFFLNGVISI